jgi:hypothetical protein
MRYAMLVNATPDDWDRKGPHATPEAMQAVLDWFDHWGAAGKLLPGGADLDAPEKARTIRSRGGHPVVTDGPYLELKEVIGGVTCSTSPTLTRRYGSARPGRPWPNRGSASRSDP